MRLHKDAKIELIKSVPLFATCSRKQLAEVAGLADEIDLPSGRRLTHEGHTGLEFIVIVEGTAEVDDHEGRSHTVGPGDFLGEISLVTGIPQTRTVVATSPLRVLVITRRDFQQLLEDAPDIQASVLRVLRERMARDAAG